jgi:hypothetical protein
LPNIEQLSACWSPSSLRPTTTTTPVPTTDPTLAQDLTALVSTLLSLTNASSTTVTAVSAQDTQVAPTATDATTTAVPSEPEQQPPSTTTTTASPAVAGATSATAPTELQLEDSSNAPPTASSTGDAADNDQDDEAIAREIAEIERQAALRIAELKRKQLEKKQQTSQ